MAQILLFEARQDGLKRVPPIVYVRSVKFRRDFGEHTPKGRKVKEEAVNGRYDVVMQIFMNSSNHVVVTFKLIPELVEVGTQMRISRFVWELMQ